VSDQVGRRSGNRPANPEDKGCEPGPALSAGDDRDGRHSDGDLKKRRPERQAVVAMLMMLTLMQPLLGITGRAVVRCALVAR
jgi:hypothetical protein